MRVSSVLRIALSPFVTAAAALWLVVDFVSLPPAAGVKTMLETTSQARARAHGNRFEEGGIFRRDGAIQVLYEDFVYDDDDPTCVGSVMSSDRLRPHGWWAPTSEHYNATLMTSYWQPVTPAETQHIRDLFAAHFEASGDEFLAEYGRAIRQNLGVVRRSVPSGYLRNALAALCAILVLAQVSRASLLGLGNYRAAQRIRRGLCPKCAYDLRGTRDAATACPECGGPPHAVNRIAR